MRGLNGLAPLENMDSVRPADDDSPSSYDAKHVRMSRLRGLEPARSFHHKSSTSDNHTQDPSKNKRNGDMFVRSGQHNKSEVEVGAALTRLHVARCLRLPASRPQHQVAPIFDAAPRGGLLAWSHEIKLSGLRLDRGSRMPLVSCACVAYMSLASCCRSSIWPLDRVASISVSRALDFCVHSRFRSVVSIFLWLWLSHRHFLIL